MISLSKTYEMLCQSVGSDINEHLPTLLKYGKLVDHITEFGVRNGRSTVAWWYANPKILRCYDIDLCDIHQRLMVGMERPDRLDYKFIRADILEVEIEETDLIFFDTFHSYGQLKKELFLHGNKSRQYLMFHDTVTYGERGEDCLKPGIMAAIDEFMLENSHWLIKEVFTNNNGLIILRRE